MKATLFIVIFCVFYLSADAWVAIIRHNSKISVEHDGHCYSSSYKIGALEKEEVKRIEGQCAIATCLRNKDISISGCGVVGVEPPCYIVDGDLSKPYPNCCYEIQCPDEKASAEGTNSL